MAALNIIAISGSLRKESYNTALIRAAQKASPANVTMTMLEIGNLPLYSQDLEKNFPPEAQKIKDAVKAADAVLIATPEYNYSIPGVLKNAIDWLSRPYGQNSLEGKPAGIMSASIGMGGGAKAQYHLRQSFVFLNMHALNKPEVIVTLAQDKFDADGNIKDEKTQAKVEELVTALVSWAQKLNGK